MRSRRQRLDDSQQIAAGPNQNSDHVAWFWSAAEVRPNQRHGGTVDERRGRWERLRLGSHSQQTDAIRARDCTLSGRILSAPTTSPSRPIDDSGNGKKTVALATAFIFSRLDYCNSLLYCLPDTLMCKLQSVQNATARLITGTRRRVHITPVLYPLHRKWIESKVACLVHQSLSSHGTCPPLCRL